MYIDFFLYLIIFWDPSAVWEGRKAKRENPSGGKDNRMAGFPRYFSKRTSDIVSNSNHFAFESSKNTACFGSGTQDVQYLFLELNDVGKGREVRGEA